METVGEDVVNGRARRYFQLSASGTAVLADESRRRLVVAKEAMRLASHKLPIKCKFVSKTSMDDLHVSRTADETE